jgi:hypothetical protein
VRNVYETLAGKLEWKSVLERTRCRWEEDIETGLREIRSEHVLGFMTHDTAVQFHKAGNFLTS